LGPAAPKVHLAAPVVVHFQFIGSSSSRLLAEDCFTKLAPIHELGELQRNTLWLTALSTSDTEERINLGRRRRRRGVVRSIAGTWSNGGRCLGLIFTPQRAARAPFADADDEATREASFGFFLLPRERPHPRFSISTSVSRLEASTSAIGKLRLVERENPRWDLEEEDDAAEKACNEGIRVSPGKLAYFIYK
jgi:hypothetical protein